MAVACGRAGRRGARCGVAERAGGVGGASSCSPAISRPIPAQRGRRRPHRPPCRVRCFPGSSATRRAAARRLLEARRSRRPRCAASRIHAFRCASVRAGPAAAAGERRSRRAFAGATGRVPRAQTTVARAMFARAGRRRTRRLARRPPEAATPRAPSRDGRRGGRRHRARRAQRALDAERAPAASSARRARRPRADAQLAALADSPPRPETRSCDLARSPTARRREPRAARARAPGPIARRFDPRSLDHAPRADAARARAGGPRRARRRRSFTAGGGEPRGGEEFRRRRRASGILAAAYVLLGRHRAPRRPALRGSRNRQPGRRSSASLRGRGGVSRRRRARVRARRRRSPRPRRKRPRSRIALPARLAAAAVEDAIDPGGRGVAPMLRDGGTVTDEGFKLAWCAAVESACAVVGSIPRAARAEGTTTTCALVFVGGEEIREEARRVSPASDASDASDESRGRSLVDALAGALASEATSNSREDPPRPFRRGGAARALGSRRPRRLMTRHREALLAAARSSSGGVGSRRRGEGARDRGAGGPGAFPGGGRREGARAHTEARKGRGRGRAVGLFCACPPEGRGGRARLEPGTRGATRRRRFGEGFPRGFGAGSRGGGASPASLR